MNKLTTKMLWISVPFLGLALLLSGSCGGGEGDSGPEITGNSVIVIAIDGLRADHLGCYGGPANTPFLSAFADEAVLFEQAWAQAPSMTPSLASLMTGLYPTTHGLVDPGDSLPPEASTLAEAAQAAGLATAAFVQGAEGGDDYGVGQGFDTYRLGKSPGKDALAWLDDNDAGDFLLLVAGWSAAEDLEHPEDMPEGFPERLSKVIASRSSDDPQTLGKEDLEFARSATLKHDEHIDRIFADLVEQLRTRGVLERATLVIVGTSGLALQEHANLIDEGLYPENIRVPLLIRRPGDSQAAVVKKTVELIDLMPTLVEAAGAALPAGVQGSNLQPIMEGGGNPPYVAFSETDQKGGIRSVVMDGMLLISSADNTELFDLNADPLAQTDVGEQYPERAEVLKSHLEAWSKMVAAASLDPERRIEELDDGTLEQLKSLGYIQ
ncbi:MAG: sulfatase-like hydrolase/transferase [Thermoanaerobaculales bacterium]|nr:sulfatase-like hydrolase/transferase [Thermoanaerobaculales bacterium]